MLKPHYFILLVTLLADGGTVPSHPSPSTLDAGAVAPHPAPPKSDAGPAIPQSKTAESFRWPDEARPVVTIDGPVVLAAHAALQQVLARYAKAYPGECDYSAKAMKVNVSEAEGLYFVSIEQHVDRCGWAAPGFIADAHWWEVYAVTPEGRVLARNRFTW